MVRALDRDDSAASARFSAQSRPVAARQRGAQTSTSAQISYTMNAMVTGRQHRLKMAWPDAYTALGSGRV